MSSEDLIKADRGAWKSVDTCLRRCDTEPWGENQGEKCSHRDTATSHLISINRIGWNTLRSTIDRRKVGSVSAKNLLSLAEKKSILSGNFWEKLLANQA